LKVNNMAKPMYGWSASGDLVTGAGVNGGTAAARLQAVLEREASVTTQFNITGAANCRAEIISSVRGNRVRRLITVTDGASITTRGQTIAISARDFTDSGISNGVRYQVAILSTLGVRAGYKQPPYLTPLTFNYQANPIQTYTGSILLPDLAASCDVAVPVDAGVNSVMVTMGEIAGVPIASQAVQVSHASPLGTATPYDPRDYDWVPLNSNTTSLFIINQVPAQPVRVSVYFGIDG
jgi:hypothetical protein